MPAPVRLCRIAAVVASLLLSTTSLTHAASGDANAPMHRPRPAPDHQGLVVIAHRGASGYRPEHTLEAYALAIRQGADFIEPDLVATKDGVLVARHENEISGTTDVAQRPQFAERKTTKIIDGVTFTGWFTEDFTLAELRTLRARERIGDVRPGNTRYDGKFQVPTFAEVIRLAKRESRKGRPIGIYPETKHPTWFASEGRGLDGRPIRINLGEKLVQTLVAEGFTDPRRVYIQSFEVANLIELKQRILPRAGLSIPLVQLYDDFAKAHPYDVVYNTRTGVDLGAIYGDFGAHIEGGISATTTYGALTSASALGWMRKHYASGIGPTKSSLLPRTALDKKVDANGDGVAELASRNTGEVHPVLARALALGMQIHPFTIRAEEPYLTQSANGINQTALAEAIQLYGLGVQGIFIDQPDIGVAAREIWLDLSNDKRSNHRTTR